MVHLILLLTACGPDTPDTEAEDVNQTATTSSTGYQPPTTPPTTDDEETDTGTPATGDDTAPPAETGLDDDGNEDLESTWEIVDQYLTVDGCGMADWLDKQTAGLLEVTGTRTEGMTITHNRGVEACTITGADFDCDPRTDEDPSLMDDMGLDALLLLDLTAGGTLEEGVQMTMTTEIVADCTGDDCWLVEIMAGGMPCVSTLVVEAQPE